MTYEEVTDYIDSVTNYEKTSLASLKDRDSLSDLRSILHKLGDPQKTFQSIHVAGTKGKGSISVFMASLLEEAGYKVGLYTSPHLFTPLERISINGNLVSEKAFADAFTKLRTLAGEPALKNLTFFEIYTLVAFIYFSGQKIDYAVIECGLGGRLDATNVIEPLGVIISDISYDHMDVLGHDIKDIAREKSAVIKKCSKYIVSAAQNKAVENIIVDKAKAEGVELFIAGKNFSYEIKHTDASQSVFDLKTPIENIDGCILNMPGLFQCANASASLMMFFSILKGERKKIKKGNVCAALEKAFLPARFELISLNPRFIVDGAQNASSMKALKKSIEQSVIYDKLIVLLGVMKDKDIKGISDEIKGFADKLILTKPCSERALDPLVLRGYFKGEKANVAKDIKEAIGLAFSFAGENDLIVCAGSLYLAAEVKKAV